MSQPVLYLEPVGGIAGDMFLAAAVDLGVPLEAIDGMLRGLGVSGWRFKTQRSQRHEIAGTHLDVEVDAKEEHAHRALSDIQKLIRDAATLPPRAKERALAVFQTIGAAEAKIHNVPIEQIHFHEVGAVDSIVDICGAAAVLELLGDPQVFAAPPPLGSGTQKMAHGNIPIPAPATLEILRDVAVKFEGMGELTTPTGAALLKTLATIGSPPEMVIERVGYGLGTKDFKDRANVLRASLGRTEHSGAAGTYVLETNLDDCNPQFIGALLQKLLDQGALDAYVLPAVMKKSRPGHLLGVVAPGNIKNELTELLLRESTTLGVRSHRVERTALERSHVEVSTPYGSVRVKLGLRGGETLNSQPEYEDCRARAEEKGVPVKQVWAEALAAYFRR
ncbi:MAG: nickel pincer cofactor biosynthesis protein LarC [Myxococcaceae bacterium]